MPLDAVIWQLFATYHPGGCHGHQFWRKKLGCGESVGLVPFSAKYIKFSRQRDPHGLTDTLIQVGLGNLWFLQVNKLVDWRLQVLALWNLNGNYELSFRQIKEESTDGSGSVCRIGFYGISYVLGVCSVGRLRCQSWRIQHPVLESSGTPGVTATSGLTSAGCHLTRLASDLGQAQKNCHHTVQKYLCTVHI